MKDLLHIIEGFFDNTGVARDTKKALTLQHAEKNFDGMVEKLIKFIKSSSAVSAARCYDTLQLEDLENYIEIFSTVILDGKFKLVILSDKDKKSKYNDCDAIRIFKSTRKDHTKIEIYPLYIMIDTRRAFFEFFKMVYAKAKGLDTASAGLTNGNYIVGDIFITNK